MRQLYRGIWNRGALLAGIVAPLGLLAAVGFVQTKKPAMPATAGQRFKNIQVLKNLQANQLIPTMRKMSDSLGVRCDFCHVVNADHTGFERDDKETKRTARKMILMVYDMDKREKVLNKKATCYMCHRGQPVPAFEPPAPRRIPRNSR